MVAATVSNPMPMSGRRTRGRLTPAVNIDTISFARDIRPSEKRSASKSETGRRMMKTCGT